MKLFWTGTDSLMLVDYSMRTFRKKVYWQLFRWLIRIMDWFIQEHYCDANNVADNVRRFGTKKLIFVKEDDIMHGRSYPKKKHDGFNILYYLPVTAKDKRFTEWLYGYDIFLEVKNWFGGGINFIVVDGHKNMREVYPIIDFYLRPNRHDGASRMRRECDVQKIPYYWTKTNPSAHDAIKAIEYEIEKHIS